MNLQWINALLLFFQKETLLVLDLGLLTKTMAFLQIVMPRVLVGVATGILLPMIPVMRYFQAPPLDQSYFHYIQF